jgi:hypothetical protein
LRWWCARGGLGDAPLALHSWLPASSTLGQINLGAEICSTNGQNATWYFNDFSITTN